MKVFSMPYYLQHKKVHYGIIKFNSIIEGVKVHLQNCDFCNRWWWWKHSYNASNGELIKTGSISN